MTIKRGGDSVDSVEFSPLQVKVYNNFEKAIRAFKTLVQKEKILNHLKERSAYEKPSDKRRRKIAEYKKKQFEQHMLESQIKSGEWDRQQVKKLKKKEDRMKLQAQKRSSEEV